MTVKFEFAGASINGVPARVTRRRAVGIEVEDGSLDIAKLNLAIDAAGASPDENGEVVIELRLRAN
jgi:hypothetical protein